MTPAIKIDNISKQYRLGLVGTGTLSHDLRRWWHLVRGKEDPYLKIGEVNDRTTKGTSDYIWALKDINLEVQQGEVLGIIGKNGAGKSTLLKILSKVTAPTMGSITYRGRIGSLLEVGTGFHPELTGRENIYLNGSILGMRKKEIELKFDEIVNFSGCERYIDTPVKRYSSGMSVRLGFAVAAFLEPEIFVVDEVLAVGDAEFQKKAIGKMQDVSRNNGRTVLFVSHNMTSIKSLCSKTIMLKNGIINRIGFSDEVVKEYLTLFSVDKSNVEFIDKNKPGDDRCKLLSARIITINKETSNLFTIDQEIGIEFSFEVFCNLYGIANLHLFTAEGVHVLFSSEIQKKDYYKKGIYKTNMWIPKNFLNVGYYSIGIAFTSLIPFIVHFYEKEILSFELIEDNNNRNIEYTGFIPGIIRPKLKWETNKI